MPGNFLSSAVSGMGSKLNSALPNGKGMLADLGRSAVGNAKKAMLIFKIGQDSEKPQGILSKTKEMLQSATTVGDVLKAGSAAVKAVSSGYHALEVQYNPASISFQANAKPISFHTLQPRVDSSLPNQETRQASITMSVDLIFDAENDKDAFMADKFRLSANDVVSDVAAVHRSLNGGYTVKPQTNALIGAIMDDSTRMVTFRWADLNFFGEITQIQARYTMFSVSGKPIRSVVSLYISQRIDDDETQIDYWNKAFDKCFSPDSLIGKSAFQKVGNLLNVKF